MKVKKVLDLSHTIYNCCPGFIPYKMCGTGYEKIYPADGYTAERIDFNSHTATHLDAPYHVSPDGMTIDQMPVEWFMGDAVVLDLRDCAVHEAIGVERLSKFDGKIRQGDIVLLCTGFARRRGWNPEYCDNWPYVTGEGAQWLLDKGVKGVGIDSMSVGGPKPGEGPPAHNILLGANIWLLEEMNYTEELFEQERWFVVSLPLKFTGFGGSPTRTVAIQFA